MSVPRGGSLAETLQLDVLDRVIGVDSWDVYDLLDDTGLGDGLPPGVVRSEDVDAILGELDVLPDDELVVVPPLRTPLTGRRLAVCALLAGCRPEQAPVLAAMAAALRLEELNAYGVLTTTGTAALMTLINGPVRARLGYRGGHNCFGPGSRANATTGRFLSLLVRTVGGAREGVADMATMGQPGKYTFCVAEAEEESPWPSFATDQGMPDGESAITLVPVTGTAETFDEASYDLGAMIEALARTMRCAEPPVAGDARAMAGLARSVVFLSPEWAHAFAAKGLRKEEVGSTLAEAAYSSSSGLPTVPPLIVVCGGPGVKQVVAPVWSGGSAPVTFPIETASRP